MIKAISALVALFSCSMVFAQPRTDQTSLPIIPAPLSITQNAGEFTFSSDTPIETSAESFAVTYLADYLRQHFGFANRIGEKFDDPRVVLNASKDLPAEGYRLTITPDAVTIVGGSDAGIFYGVTTFLQLLPVEKTKEIKLPAVVIEDHPRFGHRGMHLDVSRHFFPPEFVKKYIDLIAFYKLNSFHWHLTDDQGWRIEIKKYPKLTQVGSVRAQTMIGVYWDRMPQYFDGRPYGGFYTQDEIREIVKYAAQRNVTIIPEIEMPGHCSAALASYPEFSCNPAAQHKVAETWGIFTDVYCPSETTFKFLEDVLTEVMELFPGKYIHIGGDECPKDAWKNSAFCQQLIKDQHLKDEHELQSYFIRRMQTFVSAKGRQIVGWDEILEGGLAPGATVMSWQGERGGIEAARQSHDVIMVSGSNGLYFFDKPNYRSAIEADQAKYSLEKLYGYDPIPGVLSADQQKYIKGLEAAIWSEYVETPARAEFELLPRMLMVSEIGWSPKDRKNFNDFMQNRLPKHLERFDILGTNYRVPPAIGVAGGMVRGSEFKVDLKPSVQGAKIYYTINGFDPSDSDQAYSQPFILNVPVGEQRDLRTIVITPARRASNVTRTLIYNREAPDDSPIGAVSAAPGLRYALFAGPFKSLADLDGAKATKTGIAKSIDPSGFTDAAQPFGVIFEGYLRVDDDNDYTFSIKSTGSAQLSIDDNPVADNQKPGSAPLLKGLHRLRVMSTGPVRVFLRTPGSGGENELPSSMLVTDYRVPGVTGIDYK